MVNADNGGDSHGIAFRSDKKINCIELSLNTVISVCQRQGAVRCPNIPLLSRFQWKDETEVIN